ncbi:FAD-dependent oxidoreductase [Chitinophaga pendula]|nr:FAD-dependent oxidoreductase [Chitinophaga pendula]
MKILIIGAGMAGAAAAYHLRQMGFEVTVIEARDRSGGRIHTALSLDTPIDLGAAWIHEASRNPLTKLATLLNIPLVNTDYQQIGVYRNDGTRISQRQITPVARKFEQAIQAAGKHYHSIATDCSFQAALDEVLKDTYFSPIQQEIYAYLCADLENEMGCSLHDISARAYLDASTFTDDDNLLVKGGYQQLIDHLLQDIPLLYNQPVREVIDTPAGVKVQTDTQVFEGDFVVVTVPLSILQKGAIRFSPALPAAAKAAMQRIGMGIMNKVVMHFEQTFWHTTKPFWYQIASRAADCQLLVNYKPATRQPILVALTVGAAAIAQEHIPIDQIQREWQERLHQLFPRQDIIFKSIQKTSWYSDPFAGGAYSHMRPGADTRDFEALATPLGKIRFAGEATIAEHHAYVHGAWYSGVREAKAIAAIVKGKDYQVR